MSNVAVATQDPPGPRFAKDHLKAFIERIERLEEEKKTIAEVLNSEQCGLHEALRAGAHDHGAHPGIIEAVAHTHDAAAGLVEGRRGIWLLAARRALGHTIVTTLDDDGRIAAVGGRSGAR